MATHSTFPDDYKLAGLIRPIDLENLKETDPAKAAKYTRAIEARNDPESGALYSEMCFAAAKAVGREAPITADAKTAAMNALKTDRVVNQAMAARAGELRNELVRAGWFIDDDAGPRSTSGPATAGPDYSALDERMSRVVSLRPRALATEPTGHSYGQHVKTWLARNEKRRTFSAAATSSGELEIQILDVIGASWWFEGITAKGVKAKLDANPEAKTIRLLIDSPGGDVFDGIAIQNLLKRSGKRIEVEVVGEAASAASVIAMAGDKITMHEGAMMMIHRASSIAVGFSADLRATADALDKVTDSIVGVYASRTGKSRTEIAKMVDAETWLTASEAIENRFATDFIPTRGPSAA